jgi:RNA polymerase I specific initiation factor
MMVLVESTKVNSRANCFSHMVAHDHNFLFASLGSKQPHNTRKIHIRRLYDAFQLFIARRDLARAKRAWAILVRCKEIDWSVMWTTGLQLLGDTLDDETSTLKQEFLRTMMLQKIDEVRHLNHPQLGQWLKCMLYSVKLSYKNWYFVLPSAANTGVPLKSLSC